jgi:Glycosyl transferases group 1
MAHRHVETLATHGFEAYVRPYRDDAGPPWFDQAAPSMLRGSYHPRQDDVLVLPEDNRGLIERSLKSTVRKVVFCQNHYYASLGIGTYRTLADVGINAAVAASGTILHFLRERFPETAAALVPYPIDEMLFQPRLKRVQVCYAPRKRPIEAAYIIDRLRSLHPDLNDIPFVEISEMHERQVAEVMGESAVFLSLNRLEGLGLMPLEAMASGCVVVGFTGVGGREYATSANGFWTENEDCCQCVNDLASLLRLVTAGNPILTSMVEAGYRTAGAYSREPFLKHLLEFWHAFISGG